MMESILLSINHFHEEIGDGILMNLILPITIAIITYLCVDYLGERKKRKNYSKLGVSVLESLQEEIRTGIKVMTENRDKIVINNPQLNPFLLPDKSWNGMTTISDEVMLRILSVGSDIIVGEYRILDVKIHCKNYFVNICTNYRQSLENALLLIRSGNPNWASAFGTMFSPQNSQEFIKCSQNVYELLQKAKEMLEKNSKKWFPK